MQKSLEIEMEQKQPKRDRSFPWLCGTCRERAVVRKLSEYRHPNVLGSDGLHHAVVIPNVEIPTCEKCGEQVFDNYAGDQIDKFLREAGIIVESE